MDPPTGMPQFPRGFVFADRDVPIPESFEKSRLLPHLYVHPWLKVDGASEHGSFVVILGMCHSVLSEVTSDPASALLSALFVGERHFFEAVAWYGGRFAIIFGDTESVRVVADATALRSVFYAENGEIVASHALLVERAMGGAFTRDRLPFHFGFPGNRTPYPRTKVLSPNTCLDVATGVVHRFWPTHVPRRRDIDEVAHLALTAATTSLRRASMGRPVNLALTAGLDSRVVLAVALHSGVEFETYTYGADHRTKRDRGVAKVLASDFGLRHTSIPTLDLRTDLRARLADANFASHHGRMVPGLIEWFRDPRSLAVSGNLLEIAQTTFAPWRDTGSPAPATVENMTALHRIKMNQRTQDRIAAFGEDEWTPRAIAAFQEFYDDTDFGATLDLVDPFDLYYWEHRMGLWFGTSMLERDFYAEAFIPFNARVIFEALLGIEEPYREQATAFYRIIEMVEPALLDIPINPRRVPRRP